MEGSDIFNRGASIVRIINLTYEDSGLPIDTDDLDDILCSVIHSTTTRELDNFSYLGGTVDIIDHVAGQVRFIVPQSVSALAKLGDYYVNIATHETDADHENNTHVREGMSFCFKLIL